MLLLVAWPGTLQYGQSGRPTAEIGPAAHIMPPPPNYRLPDGRSYVYSAEWRIWVAGTATLRIDTAGAQQHVSGTANSTGVVALLFKVQNRFESWFDRQSFCSQRISKYTEEALRRRDTHIVFDYAARKSVLDETNLKTGEKKHTAQDIPGCVTDVLSAFYYVGSLPLQAGNSYLFPLNDGGATVEVRATPEAREQVKTDAGTFSAIRVRIEARAGLLKDRGRIWLWYTDNAQRIPVQMRARMFWGTLTMKLQRMETATTPARAAGSAPE